MAKEIVVRDYLSDQIIEAGKTLLERLDKEKLQIQAAFWLLLDESRIWRMMIISPLVGKKGPAFLYGRIIQLYKMANENESIISTHDITVDSTSNSIFKSLKTAITTSEDAISDFRISKNYISGTYIEDAHIYRMVAEN